mmetsp:Transcript_5255/g.11709  ORF Transcript_5255/g.11709 Transcript_5255/m.11709 type:complete len:88 (+) Transcript_5255:475-738(+)
MLTSAYRVILWSKKQDIREKHCFVLVPNGEEQEFPYGQYAPGSQESSQRLPSPRAFDCRVLLQAHSVRIPQTPGHWDHRLSDENGQG